MPGFVGTSTAIRPAAASTSPSSRSASASPADEGRQRQAALAAFTAFAELKHVILVDDDVDIYDPTT